MTLNSCKITVMKVHFVVKLYIVFLSCYMMLAVFLCYVALFLVICHS